MEPTTPQEPTFVVFLSVNLDNRKADPIWLTPRHLVLFRRFVQAGLGPDITVLDEALLPDAPENNLLIVVQAKSREVLEKALEVAAGLYKAIIAEVAAVRFNPQVKEARFCLLSYDAGSKETATAGPAVPAAVCVRTYVELKAGAPCSCFWLVDALTLGQAYRFGKASRPGAYVHPNPMLPAAEYLQQVLTKPAEEVQNQGAPAPVAAALAVTDSSGFVLFNEGDPQGAANYTDLATVDVNHAYPSIFAQQKVLRGGQSVAVQSSVYLWEWGWNGRFTYDLQWDQDGAPEISHKRITLETNFPTPLLVVPQIPGETVGFNFEHDYTFHVRSKLYLWMNDLFNSNKYNAPWPELSYEGGHLAAYEYILSQIPGRVPPMKGTIKERSAIVDYPGPGVGPFTETEFQEVRQHLLMEIDHFNTVDQWFYPNGIFDAIYGLVGVVAAEALTGVATIMAVDNNSIVSMVMNTIINDIVRIIGLIPGYGSVVAAVIFVGWTTVQLIENLGQPKPPLQVAVDQLATAMAQYLQNEIYASQQLLNILYQNWGKLNEFSNGVITGIISEKMFFPPEQDPPAAAAADAPRYQPPEGLIAGAANAWKLIIYKSLFAAKHTPFSVLSFATSPPWNPWNPDAGSYEYIWYLPGVYLGSKGNPARGYLVFSCSTDAPAEVIQELFGSASQLKANPIEFFVGFNGWPGIVPVYINGPVGFSPPPPPVISIG